MRARASAFWLVLARALQGIGAALLTPGSLALLQASFVPEDRSRAIGAWSAFGGMAGAVGPFLGGWLVVVEDLPSLRFWQRFDGVDAVQLDAVVYWLRRLGLSEIDIGQTPTAFAVRGLPQGMTQGMTQPPAQPPVPEVPQQPGQSGGMYL